MRVRLRLQRFGRKKLPFYRIVAVPSSVKRDGRFLEILGLYHPTVKEVEKQVRLNQERITAWLNQGASPSNTVKKILSKSGLWVGFSAERQEKQKNRIKKKNQNARANRKAGEKAKSSTK